MKKTHRPLYFIFFALTVLSLLSFTACGSAVKRQISDGNYDQAETLLRQDGYEGSHLYKEMGDKCLSTGKTVMALDYYVKSGMSEEDASITIASSIVMPGERDIQKYINHSSYRNYLTMMQKINRTRRHRDLNARKHAINAFKIYKEGSWPSAGPAVLAEYMKSIDAKIKSKAVKIRFEYRQSKKGK